MKRIAVITGASSGIGRETALQASKYFTFDEMWLIARREERLLSLKSEIEKTESFSLRVIAMDITKEESVDRYREMLSAEENEIMLLVNNAGMGTYGKFIDTPQQLSMNMLNLNCNALVYFTSLSIPYMRENSCILNVSSLAAFMPLGNFALYAASKALVLHFSLALRAELESRGINVTALCPGSVKSEFSLVASRGATREVAGGEDTAKVVRHALKCAAGKKAVAMMKMKWKLLAFFSRFFSKSFISSITAKYYKRKHN